MSLVIKFEPGLRPVVKHQEHDQSSHGSWANSSERSAKEIEVQQRITDVKVGSFERDKYDEDDKNLYQKIEAKYKTKDGKTYLLSQENIKTPDGNNIIEVFSYEPKTLASGKAGRKQIGSLGTEGRDSSIIDGVYVEEEHQRQGIATAMLNMARTYAPDNMKISHSFSLTDDAKGWSRVVKHQEHDQSTHGSWANGSGSSGLSHREIYNLQVGRGDPLVSKIYKAEDNFQPHTQRELPMPFPPKPRVEFATKEEYDKAYKAYSKAFDEWARESHRNIQSPLGEKHLDGSRAGVQKYIDETIGSDWFKEEFGTGGVVERPQAKLLDINSAGRYVFGFKNGQPYTSLVFNKGYSKAEPTILHELAHYATTISQTKPFDGHGVEFAKNHVYIASRAIGKEYADGLAEAYRGEGIDLG